MHLHSLKKSIKFHNFNVTQLHHGNTGSVTSLPRELHYGNTGLNEKAFNIK